MILSNMLFPSEDICREEEMYYKGYGYEYRDKEIVFKTGGVLSTSTYFNSFSADKWKKYTIIDNVSAKLQLSGEFSILLYCMHYVADKIEKKLLRVENFKSSTKAEFNIEMDLNTYGVQYIRLEALSDNSVFYGGCYTTDIDTDKINNVKLAIGICTYKREKYVIANINRLKDSINNAESPLHDNLDVFVSDNGQTLPIEELQSDHIFLFNNKNLGGAGGFTRCLIEAKKQSLASKYTNFVFMDDDIILDTKAIEKNFVLLSLLKPEHQNSIVGGAMFSTDDRFLQFENAAKWQNTEFIFNRRNVDMRYEANIVLNEKPYDVNYNAWCYCCIPFDIVTCDNLPLPVFFHMDDIEYCLRNKLPVITLNGINVWHLYKKGLVNAKNDYYDIRNKLIMMSEIDPQNTIKMARIYLSSFSSEVLKYHYARAINAFNGILDFCKGFEYFKNLDTQKQHGKLFNNVKWLSATDNIKNNATASSKDIRRRRFKVRCMFTKFLPSFGKARVVYNENSMSDAKGAKYICVYNFKENMYISYKKSLILSFVSFTKWLKIKFLLKNKFPSTVTEFNHRLHEIQHIDFWNNYLGLTHDKHKKILFVASDNDATSGAFRSMAFLNEKLITDHNIDTCVLLPREGDGVKLLKQHNIRYSIIDSEDWIVHADATESECKTKLKRIKNINRLALKKTICLLKNEHFDLIHINTSYHYVSALAARKLHIPVVWHLREFLEEDQNRRFIDKKNSIKLINNSAAVIAISDSLHQKYAKDLDCKKLITIYNGIDTDIFYNKDKTVFKDKSKLIFIMVGFIAFYKGQHYLLEACGKLKEKWGNNFEIWLVGNNTDIYMKKVLEVISQYGLENYVKFLGRRSDTVDLYAKSDVAFICSKSEAFGRVTVEAMMSGCLVIGANTAGTKEIIDDGIDGLLYEMGSSDDLCDKIYYAVQHPEQMQIIADKGRKKAIEKYSAKLNADNIYSLYEQILGGK